MPDEQFDVDLEDSELMEELGLTTDLIVAATASDDRLSQREVDDVLGIDLPAPRVEGDGARSQGAVR